MVGGKNYKGDCENHFEQFSCLENLYNIDVKQKS